MPVLITRASGKEDLVMSKTESRRENLENLWTKNGAWRRSSFVRDFLKWARGQYPIPQSGEKAAWPEDEEGIKYRGNFSQNLVALSRKTSSRYT
jgi:hypothetical protein